jgi:hypothetical protein
MVWKSNELLNDGVGRDAVPFSVINPFLGSVFRYGYLSFGVLIWRIKMKSPRHSCYLALLLILAVCIPGIAPQVSGADHDLPLLVSSDNNNLNLKAKGPSASGFDYFAVEEWDGNRLWSNKEGGWNLENVSARGMGGIWGLDGRDIFVAGGWSSDVLHYQNGEWIPEAMPFPLEYVSDVWGFGRENVFAIGTQDFEGTINLFHYNGNNWTAAGLLTQSFAFEAIWGASPSDVYMVGEGGDIAHFDGETMTPINTGFNQSLYGIWGTGSQNIYAVGDNATLLHFDGNTWQQESTPAVETTINNIWGLGPDNIYAAANHMVLHYDGTAWTEVEGLPEASDFYDVYGSSPTDIYVVGWSGLIVHFDGESWTTEVSGSGTNYRYIWGGLRSDGDQNWAYAWDAPVVEGEPGFNGDIYQITDFSGQLAACGRFTMIDGEEAQSMAFWNGSRWVPLYASTGPDDEVHDLEMYQGNLYCAGSFTSIDGNTINCVAAWEGTSWVQLGAGLPAPGTSGVWDLIVFEDELYALGEANTTAKWDGSTWTTLNFPPEEAGFLFEATIHNGELYAGGLGFSQGAVKRLVGNNWTNLDPNMNGFVYSVLSKDNVLYVGGEFGLPGQEGSSSLATWTGSGWQDVGAFVDGPVVALKAHPDGMFVGGQFGRINGIEHGSCAIWDEGENWTTMGSGINDVVFDAIVEGQTVVVAGRFEIAGNHTANNMAQWSFTELAIPEPPASGPAAAGEDHTVSINIQGSPGSNPVYLHYRLRDGDRFLSSLMTPSANKDGLFETTVPGSFFEDLGFQFFVSSGSEENPVFFPSGGPSDPEFTPVVMVNESLGIPTADQYVMMGVPFQTDQGITELMEGAFGSYDKSKWRCGRWDPLTSSYDEFPNVLALGPGRGYWLIQKTPVDLPATGVSTSTVGAVVLTLEPGWNMIATPYNFLIPWSSVVRGPNVENRLVARSGGGYVDVQEFNPWQGYWVRNTGLNSTTLTINPTPVLFAKVASEDPVRNLDAALWAINLDVDLGDRYDVQNVAAIVDEASGGIDDLDYFEAPALPGDVSLFFANSEGETDHALSRDVRPPFTEGVAWDVVLRHEGGGLVDMNISGVEGVPAEHRVSLVTQDGTVDLRQVQQVAIRVGSDGETRLRLVVGDPAFVQESERSLPRPFALKAAYPNPFNPMTTVGFTLPKTSRVSLDIFDIRGHLVRHLVDEDFEAGLHEVPWNGLDDSSRSVSAGVYFSRMRSEGFEQTRKMTLVR